MVLTRILLVWLCIVLATVSAHAEILIGVPAPLSGSIALMGETMVLGASFAVDQLNAKGGVLGQKLVVETVDDFCDGPQAVAAANKLVAEHVAAVIGHQCSGAAIPASEIYEQAGIIFISPLATNPKLTERGLKRTFRVCGRDDEQGPMASDYIVDKLGGKSVAIVYDERVYGAGIAHEMQQRLHARGLVETVFRQIIPGQLDFGSVIDELVRNGTGILYYGGYAQEAGLLIRQAKERVPNLQMIAPDGIAGEDFPLIAGPAADGTLMTNPPDPRFIPAAAELLGAIKKSGYRPDTVVVNAYTAVQVWAQAVEAAGTTASNEVEKALRTREFTTVLGTLRFDAKGDVVGIKTFFWYVWRSGDYTPLEGSGP
jgi:branched-chain amino acid transport system substrate-binding protein